MVFRKSHPLCGLLLLFFLFVVVSACQKKETPLPGHPGGEIFQGEARFDVKCHGCHGWLGEGSMHAPALSKPGEPVPFKRFYSAVTYGRGVGMPAYQRILDEKEIRLIMDWLEKVAVIRERG